jgi:hypothetical protein
MVIVCEMKRTLILCALSALLIAPCCQAQKPYTAVDGWVVGHYVGRYNNRPIYLNNCDGFVLAGDRPLFTFAKGKSIYGVLVMTYVHGNQEKRLCDFEDITSAYKACQMTWTLRDKINPSLQLKVEMIRRPAALGVEFRITGKGLSAGDCLKCEDGGSDNTSKSSLSWKLDVQGHPDLLNKSIDKTFRAVKSVILRLNRTQYLGVTMNDDCTLSFVVNVKKNFDDAYCKLITFQNRLTVDTPDEFLHAMANASLAAVDGTWYPPVFHHGCMQWNNRLPGWRTLFGGIMYGWHDRIFDEAKFYIDAQVRKSDKITAKADTALLLTGQDKASRFYGVGRIMKDQNFYDMQSQMFDQLVEEYRWNCTPEYVALLRPALELHLQWMDECFDPDCDGLYESYINTWPTDSQWYNGGGTAEETSYAYRAHLAAFDMAVAAGDTVSATRHRLIMNRIKKGFTNLLWLKDQGHSGAYREQGGYQRVHADAWLYSIFLPIDAELVTPEQSLESLYYPEYALQNDTVAGVGRMVWTSNWVPGIWSVRQLWPGDNYHLALSCFQSGLPNEGWEIMKGTFVHTGFRGIVPGDLGAANGGTDFGDCVHTFARALVSGLFGFRPDYPKGEVTIAPSFPTEWRHASIATPDFKLKYKEENNIAALDVQLAREAKMCIRIPVQCNHIESVSLNGKQVDYSCRPVAGRTEVVVATECCNKAHVDVRYDRHLVYYGALSMKLDAGSEKTIEFREGTVLSVYDPQRVFAKYRINGSSVTCSASHVAGFHTVIFRVRTKGGCEQWRIVHLNVVDRVMETVESEKTPDAKTFKSYSWKPVDLSGFFNADIRDIFKQKYLSPRPNTVSVRMGTDGYSLWTYPYWKSKLPNIQLDSLGDKLHGDMLTTPQGVKFHWRPMGKNVSFVSLWDNYPDVVTVATGNSCGKVVSMLVCGSTNVMQCRVANAAIYIRYTDGEIDTVALVPPLNYWNLCPIDPQPSSSGQASRTYYWNKTDRFCMPAVMPSTVSLGKNCIAMLISRRLKESCAVESITLKCLSQEVVVGLMGISFGQ